MLYTDHQSESSHAVTHHRTLDTKVLTQLLQQYLEDASSLRKDRNLPSKSQRVNLTKGFLSKKNYLIIFTQIAVWELELSDAMKETPNRAHANINYEEDSDPFDGLTNLVSSNLGFLYYIWPESQISIPGMFYFKGHVQQVSQIQNLWGRRM